MRAWDDDFFDNEFEKTSRTARSVIVFSMILTVLGLLFFAVIVLLLLNHFGVI
jgi:uncharacterized membrane protein